MNLTAPGLTSLLTGTSGSPKVRLLLHAGFWLVTYLWFRQQAIWVVGEQYPIVTVWVALAKMAFAVFFFYAAVACLGSKWAAPVKWASLLLLVVGVYVAYGLLMFYLYRYLSATYAEIPTYVKALTKAISQRGPWTFLQEPDVFYFHLQQLLMGLLLPMVIKGVRSVFRANYKSVALEKDNLKLELDFLRSQINPHFLFNTLNSVYALVEDKDQTAASVIHSLSNIMRFALYDANTAEVEVTRELETIRHYLDIQEVRHSRRLSITWEIAPQLERQRIPPLLLLTFVENAIKHGVDKYINQSCITIKAYYNAQQAFCFEVVNSLPPQKAAETREGIGISNTRRRLNLLYPGRHTLETQQTEKEYRILLKIW